MARYEKINHRKGKFSEWEQVPERLDFMCCDCGLVHNIQFRTVKGNIQWRMKRDNRATAQSKSRKTYKGIYKESFNRFLQAKQLLMSIAGYDKNGKLKK